MVKNYIVPKPKPDKTVIEKKEAFYREMQRKASTIVNDCRKELTQKPLN